MEYHCSECHMGVKGLICAKCGAELRHEQISVDDNTMVQVSVCPNGCGKIKSPQCCGQDMQPLNK